MQYHYLQKDNFGIGSKLTGPIKQICSQKPVSVWKWVQKYKPKRVSGKRKKTDEFTVDETSIKIGSEFIWLRVAIEPKIKEIFSINHPENTVCC
jgi:putative transposase